MKLFAAMAILCCLGTSANAAAPPPTVSNAFDGIFAAFRTHPLVGLADFHGLAQEQDFYAALMRDPRFAREVGNVVLETGDAAQQDTVDRYVNGETVPYDRLRKVWSDTVGWYPAVTSVGAINVYATIRAVNLGLPPGQRIKVWLGDPPIDWSKIKSKADWDPLEAQRESFPAALIEREIFAKNKKALVIYGAAHLEVYPGFDYLRKLIEDHHPKAFFFVTPYDGYATKACAAGFEKKITGWISPSLVSPIVGSSLETDLNQPGCNAFVPGPSLTQAQIEAINRNQFGLTSDALLYLGPHDSLTYSPDNPDIYLDQKYRAELERRSQMLIGKPFDSLTPDKNPAVARPYWAN